MPLRGAQLGAETAKLGTSDEQLSFRDEKEEEVQEEQKRSSAEHTDLDDVKSSPLRETETKDSKTEVIQGSGGMGTDLEDRSSLSLLLQQALREQQDGGPFQTVIRFPFFIMPDLNNICGAFSPFQWPLLNLPGTSVLKETPAAHMSSSSSPRSDSFSPQSPNAGVIRTLQTAKHSLSAGGVAKIRPPLSWLVTSSSPTPHLMTSLPPSLPVSVATEIKEEPGCSSVSSTSSVGSISSVSSTSSASLPERKWSCVAQEVTSQETKPHIKKPLNAFMLFMREQRETVTRQSRVKESAAINQILGHRWHSLSKEEQTKYYELAQKERLIHSKLYPGWSARDNYGKKKKRKRTKNQTDTSRSVQDFPIQLKKPHPPAGQTPHALQLSVSHLTHTHPSQSSPAPSLDSPPTPSSALASPATPAPIHTEQTLCWPSGGMTLCDEQLEPLALTTKPQQAAITMPTSANRTPPSSNRTPLSSNKISPSFNKMSPSANRMPPSSNGAQPSSNGSLQIMGAKMSPSSGTPPLLPFLALSPSFTHQSAGVSYGALTQPLCLKRVNKQ